MKRRFTLVTLLVIVIVVVIAVFTVNQKFLELKASELNLLIIYLENMLVEHNCLRYYKVADCQRENAKILRN